MEWLKLKCLSERLPVANLRIKGLCYLFHDEAFYGVEMILCGFMYVHRTQLPRGLRRGSVTARLLRLWVRIPRGHRVLSVEYCVLLCRGLCFGLITNSEKSYRVWCVWGRSWTVRRPWPTSALES
jgi:hypothetical protein